jgi:hypothetical protein
VAILHMKGSQLMVEPEALYYKVYLFHILIQFSYASIIGHKSFRILLLFALQITIINITISGARTE